MQHKKTKDEKVDKRLIVMEDVINKNFAKMNEENRSGSVKIKSSPFLSHSVINIPIAKSVYGTNSAKAFPAKTANSVLNISSFLPHASLLLVIYAAEKLNEGFSERI